GWRQARLPAQQPPQGLVQRRALDGERAPAPAPPNHPNATHADDALGERTTKVSGLPGCFTGAIDPLDWAARQRHHEFDFGYVLTVHKAQGSQWDDVVLFDESSAFPDNRDRWLYTGVTRAAKRLTVVV